MKIALFMCALLALSAITAEAAEPPAHDAAYMTASDLLAHPPATLDGYWATKKRVGDDTFHAAQQDMVVTLLASSRGSKCNIPGNIVAAEAAMTLADGIKDEVVWRRVSAQVTHALVERDAISHRLVAGKTTATYYADVADAYRRAGQGTDPRARDLARQVATDRFTIKDGYAINRGLVWARGLPKEAQAYLQLYLTPAYCEAHNTSTDWLHWDFADHGWPKISTSGAQMDHDAGLLAIDALDDIDLQHRILDALTLLLSRHDTSPENYAGLYDQIAWEEKRPQRYGTKIDCDYNHPGEWTLYSMEDVDQLDARRATLGLPTESDYTKDLFSTDQNPCP